MAGFAIENVRDLIGPALRLAAVLAHAEVDGTNVKTLRDVADLLELDLPSFDATSAAGQLAERIIAARTAIDRAVGHA